MSGPGLLTTSARDPQAFLAAGRICRRGAPELYQACSVLRRPMRDAVRAIGAFCSMMHEALCGGELAPAGAQRLRSQPLVAAPGGCGDEQSVLWMVQDRIAALYAGQIELPLAATRSLEQHALAAIAEVIRAGRVQRQDFEQLAAELHAAHSIVRYPTWTSLLRHCTGTGGTVGRLVSAVLGLTHSQGRDKAAAVGAALALCAVLRRIGPDWQAGRLMLPLEDLARFRYSERDFAGAVANERFISLIMFQTARARHLLRDAAAELIWLADDRSRLMVGWLIVQALRTLERIDRRPDRLLAGRVELSRLTQLRCLADARRLARRRADQPLPDLFGG